MILLHMQKGDTLRLHPQVTLDAYSMVQNRILLLSGQIAEHQLRIPVTVITRYLDLLEPEFQMKSQQRWVVQRIPARG